MKFTTKSQNKNSLKEATIGTEVYNDTYRELADQGRLVNVTNWVQPEMTFCKKGGRVQLMLTAELWRLLVSISPWARRWQTIRSRGNELLWLASFALRQARSQGRHAYTFQAFLPTEDDSDGYQTLRVEYSTNHSGRPVILIGFAEHLALL